MNVAVTQTIEGEFAMNNNIKSNNKALFTLDEDASEIKLHCPISMPDASGFLWNNNMMLQMNCRGYASAQHMQPEPAKYSYGQSIEAKTFMQPEHHYHASHPGRFFYIKVDDQHLFSLPYEPMRVSLDKFEFFQGTNNIGWRITQRGLHVEIKVKLAENDAIECWEMSVINQSHSQIKVDIYPCFSIGYTSWMNQSACFDESINGIIANYVTPYQKVEDYYKNKDFLDTTVLMTNASVLGYEAQLKAFEGEGGLHAPSALKQKKLANSVALYQTPVAVLHHQIVLPSAKEHNIKWLFGPAKNVEHANTLKKTYLSNTSSDKQDFVKPPAYLFSTQDKVFDNFVNTWLPRQIQYHSQSNRLTRDPQTRNFLQDHMASVLISPSHAKTHFLFALAQQHSNGAMPDGILLHPDAELKYINQIPHSDHNVWLFIFLDAYLQHSGDVNILNEQVGFSDLPTAHSVYEHLKLAAEYLYSQLDHRGLSLIQQGDWCDPMNMVGKEGKGVSFWLSLASAYAFGIFASIAKIQGELADNAHWLSRKTQLNDAVNQQGWDGQWYARGICDNGRIFGVAADKEGQIFLNPQSWAMLSHASKQQDLDLIFTAIDNKLKTPYGIAMLAPAYTQMDADIGRVTQKFPGSAENGSVYNHAASFYAFALFKEGFADRGYEVLRSMLVDNDDALVKQQLPNFIPNYYRGAYYQYPEVAGKSSHLFNTGTCAWFFRCVVELMYGITKTSTSIKINPCIPSHMLPCSVEFKAFGQAVNIHYESRTDIEDLEFTLQNASISNHMSAPEIMLDGSQNKALISVYIPTTEIKDSPQRAENVQA
ncbi:GH36-type glycosyl hydrolase domain-containing protein [Glaciecola petra]|uniref:NdvB protein n=1 Tax=Glaciecola petra TaxID=3075602 RepID=A0ABU2ZRL4_9ALTE|nr:NdvB protein [Aestuariibacter sp. P117]MDT0595278.1 NdvB protein [Aestuariibacter sp. P117]